MNNESTNRLAESLDRMIGSKPFLTISKRDCTELWRRHTNDASARLGTNIVTAIERELLTLDIVAWPKLNQSDDAARLFRRNTLIENLARMFMVPNRLDDIELTHAITKLKGLWVYPDEPTA